MSKSARYLISRLLLYCVFLSLVLSFAIYIAATISFDPKQVVQTAKERWVTLLVFRELPLIVGIALVFSMFYVTGFTLRESAYLKGAKGIPFAELMPVHVGFSLFIALIILVLSIFIRPMVATEMQGYRVKKDFSTFTPAIQPEPKLFQEAVRLYYRGKYAEGLRNFDRFLKTAPYNRLAMQYRNRCRQELSKLVAFQRAERIRSRFFQEGLSHYRAGRFYKAIAVFERILKAQPRHEWAKRFLNLSRNALSTGKRSVDADAALKRRIAVFLRRGIEQYTSGLYWESWQTMRDILMLSPYDVTAEEYLKKNREKIAGFDYFPSELTDLTNYPARRAVFIPMGGNRFVFADWFVKKRTSYYILGSWLLELTGDGALNRAIRSESGKWIGTTLVLKKASLATPASNGLPRLHDRKRISIPGTITAETLWDAVALMEGYGYLDPVAIINLVSYFSSSRISLLQLKLSFTGVFALPLIAFSLSLLMTARAWKNRHMAVSLDKRFIIPVFVLLPPFLYFILTAGIRLMLGIERIGVALSPLASYLLPVTVGLILVIGSFSIFYRCARFPE